MKVLAAHTVSGECIQIGSANIETHPLLREHVSIFLYF